jgi:hypothetical protein
LNNNAGEVSRALTVDKRHYLEIIMAKGQAPRMHSINCWLQFDLKKSCSIFERDNVRECTIEEHYERFVLKRT